MSQQTSNVTEPLIGSSRSARSLSNRQREHTKKLHKVSDAMVMAKLLVILNSSKELYGRALSSFYPVICAVEEAVVRLKDQPHMKGAVELVHKFTRKAAMESDLEYYLGSNWQQMVYSSAELRNYVEYVAKIEREQPLALMAFLYTNHMAFCSGGRIIRSKVRSMFELPQGVGTKMYEFEGDTPAAKEAAISWFDGLSNELTDKEQDYVISECGTVFKLNNALFSKFPVTVGSSLQAAARILRNPHVLLAVSLMLGIVGAVILAVIYI